MEEPGKVEEPSVEAAPSSTPLAAASTPPAEEGAEVQPLEELLRKDAKEAEEAKVRGNGLYADKDFAGAVAAYTEGVELCPTAEGGDGSSDGSSASAALLLSVLYNNRAAAHLQLQSYADVIADCTASLAVHPSTKALLRRSVAYERSGKLAEAISDLSAAIAQGGGSREEEGRLRRLEADKKAADERTKDEMLGKLKELGNGLLGKFGMSLDNFKAVKDPSSGSYSISFNK